MWVFFSSLGDNYLTIQFQAIPVRGSEVFFFTVPFFFYIFCTFCDSEGIFLDV